MPKVTLNWENIDKCRCGQCPVLATSGCAKAQVTKIDWEKKDKLPLADQLPGVYCSHGKTICSDFDNNQSCVCPSCAVWSENGLKGTYFCLNGSADEIES